MTHTEALRLALGALESKDVWGSSVRDAKEKAITAIKKVLKAKDEPVAWMFQHEETGRTMCVDAQQLEWGFEKGNPRLKKIAPLYTAPPQRTWVGLTDEEIGEVAIKSQDGISPHDDTLRFARAIEAKLKEKNT